MPIPTLEQVRDRLKVPATLVPDAELAEYYNAELANQQLHSALVVDEATYPPEYAVALYRRVGRVLALKPLLLGILTDEFGSLRAPANDWEIDRLEGPYRTIPIA